MPNKIDALYSEVSKSYEVGSIDDFKKYLADPKKRQLFFKEVIAPEYDVKSIDDFDEAYGFKKKSTESPSQGVQKDIFSVSGETPKAGPSASSVNPNSSTPLWLQNQEAPKPKKEEEALPFMPPKPKGISLGSERVPEKGPIFGVENPEFKDPEKIDKTLARLQTSLVDMDEEQATEKLKYLFGDLGFSFDQAGIGYDAITVTSPTGKQLDLSWDTFTKGGDEAVLTELKDFISKESKAPSNVERLQKYYNESNKKFVDQREVNETIATLSKKSDDINNFIKNYSIERDSLEKESQLLSDTPENLRDANWESRYNNFLEKTNKLEEQRLSVIDYQKNFEKNKSEINNAVGKYMQTEEKMGWWGGLLLDEYLRGKGGVVSSATALVIDGLVNMMPTESLTGDYKERFVDAAKKLGYKAEDYNKLKTSLSEDQIEEINDKVDDELKKQLKYQYGTLETAREASVKTFGSDEVTKQYQEKFKEGFLGGAIAGLAGSLPSMLGPAPARVISMYSNITDSVNEEMEKDPELSKLSETEKSLVSVPIGIVSAILEEFGLRNVVANKGVLNKLVMRMLGKVGPKTTSRTFAELVRNDVESMVARGLLTVGGGALAEFETGALQEASEQTIKGIYNEVKGKDVFKNIAQTPYEFVGDMLYAGAQEAVGGFVLGSIPAVSAAYRKQGFEGMSDVDFEKFERIANDDKIESAFVTSLKTQVNSGDVSVAEAKETLNDYRKSRGLYKQLPENLSIENKKKAMNLLRERQEIEQQISGKDEALIKTQKSRIQEINGLLENISKPENNAVQKQTTGEVPVQPKARVGQEVVEGKPQPEPQVAAEEGKEKVVPAGKRLFNEPNPETVEISKTYKEKNGIVEPEGVKIEAVDVDNASRIADAYEALQDTPDDPEVQEAYNAMADETAKQHQDIIDAGYQVELWQGEGEPYANAQEMIDDVKNNKHMYIYSTEQGFGDKPITEEQRKQNKLLQDSGFKDKNGNTLLYNDLFRFVHDFFGHTERGNGFGPVGEENAWDVHARMYTPKARRAMTTETRGQNSWVNFGPQMRNADGSLKKKGDEGYLSPQERQFAPQKMALMPEEFSQITEVTSNFDQAVNKSAEALNVVAPDLKVIVGENIDDVQNRIVEAIAPLVGERQALQTAEEFATGTKGQTIFVDGKPFAVVFDKTTADSRTAGHEAWEVMLNDAFGNDQAKFKEFTDSIDSQLRAQGFDEIADKLDTFASQKGYEAVKYSEYMAELGGMLVESGFGKGPLTAQQKTLLQKIGDIINKFAELFTGKKQFLDQATPEDILGFMVTISNKVSKGEDVSSFFRKSEKAKANEGVTSRKQAEKIFTGEEKVPTFKSLPEIANWLEGWSKKNKIFAKDIKDVSDKEFVKKLEEHTLKELSAWDGIRGQEYVSFYVGDIVDRLNPKLQKFAQARYGRMLTPAEVTLYHAVSGFASPQADPMFDSSKGLEIFDKYMNGGKPDINKLSGYADKQATVYELNDKGKKVDTGKLKFDKEGNPVYSQVSMHYAVPSLNKMKSVISHFDGDLTKAMEWMTSIHSYDEISEVMGTPLKGSKALTPHENLSKEDGGFGIFGFTGAKLGSYILNRIGEYSTVTKDMWYARTMARLVGEPLTKDGKAMTDPWSASTVAGVKKRKLADQAWESVAKKLNITPSDVQERMWDFEKRLYEKMGAIEKASYASEGFMKTAKKLEPNVDLDAKIVESRSQKAVPPVVDEVLTDDGKGNYLFVHYSRANRDVIKPMSGSKENFTSKEEVSAISSVGGVAMYYTKAGQKENGVGDVPHTVLVPKDKVYFYGTTDKGTVSHDPEGFEAEARRRFQEYKNRGNEKNPTVYAFDSNNAAAWVTKVAGENGYDMVVTNWGGPKSYRAQTTKTLKAEDEYTGFKKPEPVVFEVGDEIFVSGSYGNVTAVNGSLVRYEGTNQYGGAVSGVFDTNRNNGAIMIEKAKPVVTTRAQKVEVKTIPGYDRMMNEVEGIMDKTMNRGGSYNQASANAINYLQKSAVYEKADDIQREQIVRDFKKMRGEKMKNAPSVAKIMGQIKDVKEVTVKESTALKDQIKLEAKAARESAAFVKQLRMDISNQLKSMVGRGVISARQATAIISRYDKMNILNPVMRDRFVDYMSRVFQSAEYTDKIKEASKLRASIKKAMKSPANQAEIAKLAKNFADIDPARVENIDDYINNATQMLNAVARKTGDPLMRSLVNAADMKSYIDTEIESQREQIKNELLDKYKELVDAGVLSSDMTINEIKKIVAAIEENEGESVAKEEKAKAAVKEMMAEVSPLIVQIVKTGEDPFTGEPIVLTQDEKKSLIALTKMDTDSLSLSEAVQVLEYANNFVANGITSGIDGMVSLYQGGLNAGELVDDGFKAIPLSKYFSKVVGRVWGQGFATLPMLNKLLWGNTRRAIMVSEKAGINGVSNGKAKALKMVDTAVKQYVKQFSKVKDFLASENVIERGVFAFMSRNVIGDEFQVQDEFNRRKTLIEETIQALKDVDNNTDAEIKKGEVIQKVYDKVLKDAKNINDVKKNVSQINQDAVNWWIKKWSENFDRIDEVSRNVYNTELSRDIDFTPDRFQLKEAPTAVEEDFDSGFFGNFEYVDTSKSGSLRKNNRISNLPKDKNGVKRRIVNLDFDVNNVNALTSAMVDVETASSVMQMKGFVTSKNFSKLFSNKDDKNLYKKRLIKYVNRAKGGSYVDQNELAKINRFINTIASFGVAKALFSVSQPFKQFIPPMLNTLSQTGRFDIGELFNGAMEFIDKSGYPIANRGVASQGELKSINRQLVEAEKNAGVRILDFFANISNKALELTLKNPDVYAARASWISFYLKGLQKQGQSTSSIDWSTHQINKEAADYAQAMVDSQQNISDTDMQGEIFASKQPATVFLRRAILPLMTFTLNQKTRVWSDIRTLSNDVSSKEDKMEAAKSLTGALVELAAFQGVALAFKELYNTVANAIMGEDEDEEEKKIRRMRQSQSTAQAFMKDFFLPPVPGMDIYASKGINYLLDETGLSEELPYKWFGIQDEEQKYRLYDKFNQGYLNMLGTQGIAAEKAFDLAGYYDAAIDGEFTKEYNGNEVKKALMEEDLDVARMNAVIMTAYYGGLLPSDMAYIANVMNKKIQKRAEQIEKD